MNRKSVYILLSIIIIIITIIAVGLIFKESFIPSKSNPTPTARLLSADELSHLVVSQAYTSLKKALENPDDVIALRLNDQKLSEFPRKIFKFKNLQSLNLGNNQIRVLPQEIYKLNLLQEIGLENNQITSLPPEVGRLKYLKRLDVSGNQLSSLPDGFQALDKLRDLDLCENRLPEFPKVIGTLAQLEKLDLSSNQMTDLPGEIKKLKGLTRLNIKNNLLTRLPGEIFQFRNLQSLELDDRQGEILEDMMRAGAGQDPGKVHPVINGYFMALGGTVDRLWVRRSIINHGILSGQRYRLYSFDQYLGEYENVESVSYVDPAGESGEIARTKLDIKDDKIYLDVVFGVAGDWNVFPRKPLLKTNLRNEDPFLENFLKSKGFSNPFIGTKKEIIIDLDHDGMDESLIVASNINAQDIDEFCDGKEGVRESKYSLILLRKLVDGQEENIIVAGDFNVLKEHDIAFVADVDDDQEMEFLDNVVSIETVPAEGVAATSQELYKLRDNKAEKIGDVVVRPR